MLPKKQRADTKNLKKVFEEGRFLSSSLFTLKFLLKKNEEKQNISFIVPKGVSKLSSERNRLRRLGYAAVKKYLPLLPKSITAAFIYKRPARNVEEADSSIETLIALLKK